MPEYDVLIRNGTLCDGSGRPAIRGDVAINGDKIAAVGPLADAHGRTEIDADGFSTRLEGVQATVNDLVTWNVADWKIVEP